MRPWHRQAAHIGACGSCARWLDSDKPVHLSGHLPERPEGRALKALMRGWGPCDQEGGEDPGARPAMAYGRARAGSHTHWPVVLDLGEPGGRRHAQGFRADLGCSRREEAVHAGRPHGACG